MQEQHGRAGALVEVVHPQPVLLDVAGLEGVVRQPGESLVGCAEDVHPVSLGAR